MDKAVADYLEGQQDVKSLAKESLKELKSYSRIFRYIQVARHKTKAGSGESAFLLCFMFFSIKKPPKH